MVTKEQALSSYGFHLGRCSKHVGPRGGVTYKITYYRRNGKTKTWKKQPDRFSVPVKHGFWGPFDRITEENSYEWHTDAACPFKNEMRYAQKEDETICI